MSFSERALDALPIALLMLDEDFTVIEANSAGLAAANIVAGDVHALAAAAVRAQSPIIAAPGAGPFAFIAAAPVDGQIIAAFAQAGAGEAAAKPNAPLARTFAHEVRNPLAGIRAAAQLIAKGAEPAALAALIIAEVERIRRLCDRVDSLETAPAPAPMQLNAAMARAAQIVAAAHPDLAIEEVYDVSLPLIEGDFDQLVQVFLNIAKNAAEATAKQPAPRLIMATSFRAGERVRVKGEMRSLVEARFSDNGPGLAQSVRAHLFQPFVSTKMQGGGLGLALAKEIVFRHGGRIECESSVAGAVFRVLLPL